MMEGTGSTSDLHIIDAKTIEHATEIRKLVQELADFEKYPSGPEIDANQLHQDISNGHCFAYIARKDGRVVGYCLCFHAYSTWQGRFVFMEDLYITPEYRRMRIGTQLWKRVAQKATSENLARIQWNVLDWNVNAIQFYKKMGAVDLGETGGWLTYRLCKDDIHKLANKTDL